MERVLAAYSIRKGPFYDPASTTHDGRDEDPQLDRHDIKGANYIE